MQRRFVVCFDGTWNSPDKGKKPTNVVKLVRAVANRGEDGVSQVTFYDKGVGTSGGTDKIAGGAFGAGLIANIMDGYRFIANNYEPDDEIYIFGFSRGAYTARSLAGVIALAGLLEPQHLGGWLYDVIEICQNDELKGLDQKQEALQKLGVKARPNIKIQCLGVWDTVGSLGIPGDLGRHILESGEWFPNLKKYYFPDVELSDQVEVALHAVAIDEKRAAFAPTLWVSKDGRPTASTQKVEQVWFAGVHSNVGGSYEDSRLSDIAFDWMVRRITSLTKLSLQYNSPEELEKHYAEGTGIESRTGLYVDSKFFPYQRIINNEIPQGTGFGEWFRRRFPKFDRRNIPPDRLKIINESLHVSVLARWSLESVAHDCKTDSPIETTPYRPVNLAAVIKAHHKGRSIPVVGWDGQTMDASSIPWPPPDIIAQK